MLHLTVQACELWDPVNEVFINVKQHKLSMEHSLVSISKWESKWHVPFLSAKEMTYEQAVDYYRCMTLTQNVDPNVYYALNNEHILAINEYINDEMTATTVNEYGPKTAQRKIVTSELIYAWMVALNIPFECQKWHLNRLLMLIKVTNTLNHGPKKMSKKETMEWHRQMNAARRPKKPKG